MKGGVLSNGLSLDTGAALKMLWQKEGRSDQGQAPVTTIDIWKNLRFAPGG